MDLSKLFKAQKELDDHINKAKGLQGQDLLDKKILALQVELGELANEERSWKFWSENQKPNDYAPNVYDVCEKCDGEPTIYSDDNSKIESFCEECDGVGFYYHNPLLEEYVDCLHFILSIGNELGIEEVEWYTFEHYGLTDLFLAVNKSVIELLTACEGGGDYQLNYSVLISYFDQLGYELGFTTDQIEQAYFEKRETNFKRQEQGY